MHMNLHALHAEVHTLIMAKKLSKERFCVDSAGRISYLQNYVESRDRAVSHSQTKLCLSISHYLPMSQLLVIIRMAIGD